MSHGKQELRARQLLQSEVIINTTIMPLLTGIGKTRNVGHKCFYFVTQRFVFFRGYERLVEGMAILDVPA